MDHSRGTRSRFLLLLLLLVALGVGLAVMGCGESPTTAPMSSSIESPSGTTVLRADDHAVQAVVAVQNRHTADLMRLPGVVGVGTSADDLGQPVIRVFTERLNGRLPKEVDGVRVIEQVTGRIVAHKGGPGGGVSHTAIQTPPIQLGTSGGPALDIANGYCCGGTLGALVQSGGTQYILSNSHVFAGDVVSGGNGRVSTIGDDITQPGLIDIGCVASNGQVVADLSTGDTTFPPNSTPNVDAAMAQVRPGMVRTDGAILEIGTLSSSTVGASVGQGVKKSGRTTGLTRSTVNSINVTVNVGYTDECAGTSYTKLYTGQIFVNNKGSKFQNSGDSGSLLVEDVATNPRAVGLCFAGGGGIAVANPIGPVLSHLGVTMVGN